MKIRHRIIASMLALVALLLMGAKCEQSAPAPHQEGGHKQAPAPGIDPAPKDKKFPGNVSITLWFDQQQSRGIVYFDFGQGKQHHASYAPGGSWNAIVKPNQSVYALLTPFVPGEKGRIHLAVVNNANGLIICENSNDDTGHNGGADCGGIVTIIFKGKNTYFI